MVRDWILLGMSLADCDVQVASWDDVPPLHKPYNPKGPLRACLAYECTGTCLRCHQDIDRQLQDNGGDESSVVPRFSHMNNMDPCWKFPHEELGDLFRSLSLVESMLVALEHIQISFVTIQKSRLHRFRKNVISFPQDIVPFFARMGALRQYRPPDRVNSVRGPPRPGEDPSTRPPRRAREATEDERRRFFTDAAGQLVFPATVLEVLKDGRLVLQYTGPDDDVLGQGVELPDWVTPRVQMPWHPSCLKEALVIMMRRNVGHGRVLEGLEVRWDLVVRVLQALTRLGPWSGEGVVEPLNKYYDPRQFDLLSVEDVRWNFAPKVWRGELVSR